MQVRVPPILLLFLPETSRQISRFIIYIRHQEVEEPLTPNLSIVPERNNNKIVYIHNLHRLGIYVMMFNGITSIWPVLRIRIRSDPVFLGHPDPGPGKYRIRILYPQKDPCNYNYLVIKNCLKYSFVKIIFLSLILSVIRCLDLVRKCHTKIIYFASKTYLSRIRIQILKTGSADPDPKNLTRSATLELTHQLKKFLVFRFLGLRDIN